jgi:hypothetical protein
LIREFMPTLNTDVRVAGAWPQNQHLLQYNIDNKKEPVC